MGSFACFWLVNFLFGQHLEANPYRLSPLLKANGRFGTEGSPVSGRLERQLYFVTCPSGGDERKVCNGVELSHSPVSCEPRT